MFLQSNIGVNGETKYDSEDRPLKYALQSEEIIGKIITESNNYIKAKGKIALAKVHLAKSEVDQAE